LQEPGRDELRLSHGTGPRADHAAGFDIARLDDPERGNELLAAKGGRLAVTATDLEARGAHRAAVRIARVAGRSRWQVLLHGPASEDGTPTPLPLPEEAIGLGAQWTVMNITQVSALDVLTTQTATLESLKGDVATVRTAVTQALVRGDGAMMGLPPGSSLVFTQFGSEGAGRFQVDLSEPFLFSSELLVGLDVGFEVTADGQAQSMSMTTRSQTTSSSTTR
jgi:hypothetical protein